MSLLGKILGIIALISLSYLLFYIRNNDDPQNCIELGPTRIQRVFLSLDEVPQNGFTPKLNILVLDRDSLHLMKKIENDLSYSLATKDSLNIYEIDLSRSNYMQFVFLLDICIKNNVKQIILGMNDSSAYLYPTCKVSPNKKIIYGQFYTINSNNIDFKLRPSE